MPSTAKHWDTGKYELYQGQFSKTRMCRFFSTGACTKGADCSFAHGISEVMEPPNLRKTAICKAWKKGSCTKKADDCEFAHGQSDLKKTLKFSAGSSKHDEGDNQANTQKATPQRWHQRSPKVASGPSKGRHEKEVSGPSKVTSGSVPTSTQGLQSFKEDVRLKEQASQCRVLHDRPQLQQFLQMQQLQAAQRQVPHDWLEQLQQQVLELQRLQLLREAEMHEGVAARNPMCSVAQGRSRAIGEFDRGYASHQSPPLSSLEPMRVPLPTMP
eukprot:TRINITY_DN90459_c0_g1_i1.p1 TRINITY_DN90459_c0_g1~~TRINITY_DN90459_c0_g1_i1.p1  ORF type:complete len:271 (+),score=56.93 TRINITY_DN90459_c0_g1_i1:105-917(+)